MQEEVTCYFPSICFDELRKIVKKSVRILALQIVFQTEHIPHLNQVCWSLYRCSSVIFTKKYRGIILACNIRKSQRELTQEIRLLTCIQEVLDLNLTWGTDCPDLKFLWFLSVPPNKCQDNALSFTMSVFFHTLYTSLFKIIQSFNAVQSWVTDCFVK